MVNKEFNLDEAKRTLESVEAPKVLIPLVLEMLKGAYLKGQVAVYEKWDDEDDDDEDDDTRTPIPPEFESAWSN